MTIMSILVRVCIWVLGVYKPEAFGALMNLSIESESDFYMQ